MIAIRVDANQYTATGHAMRCLSIAEALMVRGERVVFIAADEDSKQFITSRGDFNCILLNTDWKNMEQEIPILRDIFEKNSFDWLIISSYQTTDEYLYEVKKYVKVVFIDDYGDHAYPVSVLLNYNIYAQRLDYKRLYLNKDTKLWLGPKYAPLRKQFYEVGKKRALSRKNIFVSTGGSDGYGIAQKIINRAAEVVNMRNFYYHVVVGAFGKDIEIPAILKGRVEIHRNVTEMAKLMSICAFAITAGGSTLYELCACGIPSFSYSISDDQRKGVIEFDRLGIIPYCGNIREEKENDIFDFIFQQIEELTVDECAYSEQIKKMQGVVQGKGAMRIADLLIKNK